MCDRLFLTLLLWCLRRYVAGYAEPKMRSKWCAVAPFSLKCFFRGWSRCEGGAPGGPREPGATRARDRGGVLAALGNHTTGGPSTHVTQHTVCQSG